MHCAPLVESVGVDAVGEITSLSLEKANGVVTSFVVATDGVWEFLNDQEVASLGDDRRDDVLTAAMRIVANSYLRWTLNEATVDDITLVLVRIRSV